MINTKLEIGLEEILLEASTYNLREEVKKLGESLYKSTFSKRYVNKFLHSKRGFKVSTIFKPSLTECTNRAFSLLIKE